MNALGLPGASIDGILGFTILARFRLEIDPTQDRMTWTRLDYDPADPPVPRRRAGTATRPAEMQAMNALGPLAKGLAFLMGKQPEDELHPRGFLGLERAEEREAGRAAPRSGSPGSSAARPPPRPASRPAIACVRIRDQAVDGLKAAREAVAAVRPGDRVALVVRRGDRGETSSLAS